MALGLSTHWACLCTCLSMQASRFVIGHSQYWHFVLLSSISTRPSKCLTEKLPSAALQQTQCSQRGVRQGGFLTGQCFFSAKGHKCSLTPSACRGCKPLHAAGQKQKTGHGRGSHFCVLRWFKTAGLHLAWKGVGKSCRPSLLSGAMEFEANCMGMDVCSVPPANSKAA